MKKLTYSILLPFAKKIIKIVNFILNNYCNTQLLPTLEAKNAEIRFNDERNIERQLQYDALRSSARYVARNMRYAKGVSTKEELLELALKNVTVPGGVYCEFGVYQGYTLNQIAKRVDVKVHGFDSFEGLPEFWRHGFDRETFKIEAPEALSFAENVIIHVGLFNETLPKFIVDYPQPIAFLHVDCDLYSSTKCIFDYLGERLVPGSIIVFDEYFNFPGWQFDEFKAFHEFISNYNLKYKYISYNKYNEQVAIMLL